MVYNGLEDRLPNGSPLYIGVMKNKKKKKKMTMTMLALIIVLRLYTLGNRTKI